MVDYISFIERTFDILQRDLDSKMYFEYQVLEHRCQDCKDVSKF